MTFDLLWNKSESALNVGPEEKNSWVLVPCLYDVGQVVK